MTITEAKRFEMHRELKKALGDDVADTMMEHLPPTGWADVARKHDIVAVRHDIDTVRHDIDGVRRDIDGVRRDIDKVEKRLGVAITLGIGFGLAILALQVQIMLSIANL